MVTPESDKPVPYERALRVIGRHLDAEPAYHPSVLEGPDGFTVRSQPVRHRAPGRVAHFDWPRLDSLNIVNAAARLTGRKRRRYSGMWDALPSGHEDFFRALGFTLDQVQASDVSIDELPDGLSVSYVCPADSGGRLFEKRHVIYGVDDVDLMIQEGLGRRGQGHKLASA